MKIDKLSPNDKYRWEQLDKRINQIDYNIDNEERQEMKNKVEMRGNMTSTNQTDTSFRDWLQTAAKDKNAGSFKIELRADPLLTTTESGIINKTVHSTVDIMTSPAEAQLRQMGVTIMPNLTGNLVLPIMSEDLATFPGEDVSALSANMDIDTKVMEARRVTHTQSITVEALSQTNNGVYTAILQNLSNGIWNRITEDLFDKIDTDCATQMSEYGGTTLGFSHLVQQEASIGGKVLARPAYATTPSVKAYLKQTPFMTNQTGIWENAKVNEYDAYSFPQCNSNKVYFGDWSKAVIGVWKDIEIIVDPYSQAKQGRLNLTAIALVDTGAWNKNAFAILTNASIG